MKYSYAWEKFHLAVRGLANSGQPLQVRLGDAYVFHLMHIERNGLPPEIADDFAELKARLTSAGVFGTEGQVAASAAGLDDVQAHDLIGLVVPMYDRVAKYGPNGRD